MFLDTYHFFFLFFRANLYFTYPFQKDSPFFEPMTDVLRNLQSSGVMNKIWTKYERMDSPTCDETTVCDVMFV